MNAKRQFVDTNILVYGFDRSASEKSDRARGLMTELWKSGHGCVSTQVLQEFYVTVVKKVTRPLAPTIAAQVILDLSRWATHVIGVEDILAAIEIHQKHGLSFWDALIIQSAKFLGCEVLWTQDLNTGQIYEGIRVMNPFSEL